MKLLCAIAFALLPLAASAQTLNSSLLTGLCYDDYFEDTAGQCNPISADEVLTIEAMLEKYGAIITRDTDDEIAVFYLTDPEDIPVGSVQAWNDSPTAEYSTRTDEESTADAVVEQSATSAQIITTESPALRGETVFEADDVFTGPSAARKPAVAAGAAEE